MFKKLLDGELSLKDTFWKFGVVGLVFVNMLVRIFGSMLAQKLNGITILNYYRTYFNPLKMDSGMVLLTVLYLVRWAFCFLLRNRCSGDMALFGTV